MRNVLRVLFVIILVLVVVVRISQHGPPPHLYHPPVRPVYTPHEYKGIAKFDTVIDKGVYRSYFRYALKEPLFVSYTLYRGGGNCSRAKFRFGNDTRIRMATAADYAHSGYDKGHLANADDFADDCEEEKETFEYYNCLPQTPDLNRGPWKEWEARIREESQTDSLLVITGGIFGADYMGNHVYIPDYCWKVVQSLSSKQLIHVIRCTNAERAVCGEEAIATLENQLGYPLPLKKY